MTPQTLNRMWTISPSATTYSLPSTQFTRRPGLGQTTQLEQLVPGNDLGPDETTSQVSVNGVGRVQSGLAARQGPRPHFIFADGEERFQSKQIVGDPDHPIPNPLPQPIFP